MKQSGNTFYRILPDDSGWGSRYDYLVDATHKYRLPGVRCEVCSAIWSSTGISYPVISLETILPFPESPVDMDTWDGIEEQVNQLVPAHYLIPPGAEFGPLEGTLRGNIGDFMWVNTWTPLVTEAVYEQLRAGRINLVGVEAYLKHRGKNKPPRLLELEVNPLASLSRSAYPAELFHSCSRCGRKPNMKNLERFILDSASIPPSADIFRIRDFSTVIIASQRFYEATVNNGYSNVVFSPVDVD